MRQFLNLVLLFLLIIRVCNSKIPLRYEQDKTLTYEEIVAAYTVLDHSYEQVHLINVGGILDRSPYHRASQETPPESGFRGNGKHLDLNRDFIKADSKNALSLEKVFQQLHPLVFLDTHTADGSDHQYTITLIPTVYQKMEPAMGKYFHETMIPSLFCYMRKTPYEMTPYVDALYGTPDRGIIAYNDLPKISTGYASLFNTFAFMTENHVYKPYRDQVKSVYFFMKGMIEFTNAHADEMLTLKKNDPPFAANRYLQLSFIYTHSPYLEDSYMRYPVYRIMKEIKLPLKREKNKG